MDQKICMYQLVILCCFLYLTSGSNNHEMTGLHNDFKDHHCIRDCSNSPSSRVCEYDLILETYATMSKACYNCPFDMDDCFKEQCIPADGRRRLLYTVNRMFPSPPIRVCEGDRIKVNVKNYMSNGESTSIHFHGLHQMNAPSQDGVSMLTQCPIIPLSTYQYSFEAKPGGTQWYHSHVGTQRGDGIAGALIIERQNDPHRELYLYDHDLPEHVIIIQDWFQNLAAGKAMLHLHAKDNNRPDTLLINGHAPHNVSWHSWNKDPAEDPKPTPHAVFNMIPGDKYRFRLISSVLMNCPVEFYIESHSLLVIASDGADMEPVATDLLVIAGGERYDVIVTANRTLRNYWMYARGLTDCSALKTQTLSVLHYNGASIGLPTTQPNTYDQRPLDVKTLNPFSRGMVDGDDSPNYITLSKLRSLSETPDWLSQPADKKLYLEIGLHKVDNPLFNVPALYGIDSQVDVGGVTVLAQINRVHGHLSSAPVLNQFNDIPVTDLCEVDSDKISEERCSTTFCSCVHHAKIETGQIVELILLDSGKYWNISNHPMHIHGYTPYIIAMAQHARMELTREEVKQMDKEGQIIRNFNHPLQKDTVMMPDGGYVVMKFKADNPGPWFLHCHNEVHVEQGMAIVLLVGEPDTWNKEEANTCGNHNSGALQVSPSSASSLTPRLMTLFLLITANFWAL